MLADILTCKLEVTEAENITEEVDGDPVYLLEDQGRNGDVPVFL